MTSTMDNRISSVLKGMGAACIVLALLFIATPLAAEELASPTYGYAIDLPEGCQLSDRDADSTSYIFASTVLPVNTAIKVYRNKQYKTALDALNTTLNKLGADGDSEAVEWRNQTGAVASFTMTISSVKQTGWGAAAILPDNKGMIVMFTWCPTENADACNPYMISILDSLCIDRGSYYESGIMTTYAYPKTSKATKVTLTIDGKKIETQLDSTDSEAAKFVIDREYSILLLYTKSTLWKEAWLRYYRMIFRANFNRMQRPAFDIYNALAPECSDETDLAQKLLTWTQGFEFERAAKETDSDFTSLPDVLLGKGNDCDSRSMLITVLLQNMNIDSIFFISAEYSHAVAGLISAHPGQSFAVGDKNYLIGETTAKGLTWGKVAQDMADRTKWFEVTYP